MGFFELSSKYKLHRWSNTWTHRIQNTSVLNCPRQCWTASYSTWVWGSSVFLLNYLSLRAVKVYLSFLKISIALESGGHRVQLQSIVDEEEASTTRRSRVVLALLPNQQCLGVGGGLPSATPEQCWRGGRQVHRGEAEVYLSFLRVNIAPGSVRYTSATVGF